MAACAKFFWTIILSPAVSTRGCLGMDKNRKGICEVLSSYSPGLYFLFQRFLSQMQFPCNPWCIPLPWLSPILLCTHRVGSTLSFTKELCKSPAWCGKKSPLVFSIFFMGTFKVKCWPQPFLNSARFSPSLVRRKWGAMAKTHHSKVGQ